MPDNKDDDDLIADEVVQSLYAQISAGGVNPNIKSILKDIVSGNPVASGGGNYDQTGGPYDQTGGGSHTQGGSEGYKQGPKTSKEALLALRDRLTKPGIGGGGVY